MFALAALKETRFAKLSLSGVADFDGGLEGPEDADNGVDRPDSSLRRTFWNKEPELMGGGLRASLLDEVDAQFRPLKSSIVIGCEESMGLGLDAWN